MGHLNPLLGVGRILLADGHEVLCLSSNYLRRPIEDSGVTFRGFSPAADFDLRNHQEIREAVMAASPGAVIRPSPERLRIVLERAFADYMLPQYDGIKDTMREFPADIIVGDHLMLGVLPMLLGPRSQRPAVALLGTTYLIARRDDGAPNDAGFPLARSEEERKQAAARYQEYEELTFKPVGDRVSRLLAEISMPPLQMNLYQAMVELPDAYLQLTVPRFELPRQKPVPSVHFVGPLPITPNQAPIPEWKADLDGSRKVVLVTQGTLTNDDFSQLVRPTLDALENEPDILVLVTTGGKPVEAVGRPLPKNTRVAQYLPFEWALSKIDAFVTNGGYGSVNQALSFGVPIVTAGTIADRGDVGMRVAWSGVGVNLATNAPTPDGLRPAIRSVLHDPQYRANAGLFAEQARRIDTRSEVLRILQEMCGRASHDQSHALGGFASSAEAS
jgi:MGT family glycosyltransferase